MEPDRLLKLLHCIVSHGRDEILQGFRKDSCIETTCITMLVLQHFKIEARALSVGAVVYNPQLSKWMETHRLDEIKKPEEMDSFGGWLIMLGKTEQVIPGKWDGHLVTIATLGHSSWLIDISIDQCDRPKRNILMPPVLMPVEPDFLKQSKTISMQNDRGVILEYTSHPDDLSFQETPAWSSWNKQKADCADSIIWRCRRI